MERAYATLSQVTRRIDRLLQKAYAKRFWLKAELGDGERRGGGHFFGRLVELDERGHVRAQLAMRIWQSDLDLIGKRFETAGLALRLERGTVVGLECCLEFHPVYGLQLRGLDIDPAVTLGELELRRQRILARLVDAGLTTRNASLAVPRVPLRIAVVSSRDADGWRDFQATLARSGFAFRVRLFETPVQGVDAASRMLEAVQLAAQAQPELIVIVRGGGSKLDLAALDDEALARAIAGLNVPVWTGIGHETDRSVLDEVAGRSFKTPTAVAEELVARAERLRTLLDQARRRLRQRFAEALMDASRTLADNRLGLALGSRKLVALTRERLASRAERMFGLTGRRLGLARTELATLRRDLATRPANRFTAATVRLHGARQELGRAGTRRLNAARQALDRARTGLRLEPIRARLAAERRTLDAHLARLGEADPMTALKRGFALLRRADGEGLLTMATARVGEPFIAEVAGGRIGAIIEHIDQD